MKATTFYALRGGYYIESYSPDGDTVRFRPDHPTHLRALAGYDRLRTSAKQDWRVPVRLEGADAPEMLYLHTEQRRARDARARFLRLLGFTGIGYTGRSVTRCAPPAVRGWLVTRSVDINGRAIGVVYTRRQLPLFDDELFDLTPELVEESVNGQMVAIGAAYALVYQSLAAKLRDRFTELAKQARSNERGVWSADATRGFELRGLGSIGTRGALIFPKLFRRAASFCWDVAGGFVRTSLHAWLRGARASDDEVVHEGTAKRLSDLVVGSGSRVRFASDPLDLVFVPR